MVNYYCYSNWTAAARQSARELVDLVRKPRRVAVYLRSDMQTFLPYPNFMKTARSLDYRRLGKQRVETFQLLRAINGETKGWANHPAARMWRGYERTLVIYGTTICAEWKNRGYVDNMQARIGEYFYKFPDAEEGPPPWLGDKSFHLSHQSNLIRKFPEHYSSQFPGVPDNLGYIWPVAENLEEEVRNV